MEPWVGPEGSNPPWRECNFVTSDNPVETRHASREAVGEGHSCMLYLES